jgi:hypothetical protein
MYGRGRVIFAQDRRGKSTVKNLTYPTSIVNNRPNHVEIKVFILLLLLIEHIHGQRGGGGTPPSKKMILKVLTTKK